MPIFEYLCKGCGSKFEVLVRGSEKPHCPKCNGAKLEQQLSAFAVAAKMDSGSSSFSSAPDADCGPCCGGGACAMDDD